MKQTTWNILIGLMASVLMMEAAAGDSITLRSSAEAGGAAVKVSDIAQLQGPLAEAVADVEVARFGAGQDMVVVSLAQVRKQLTAQHIHWGKVTCRGAQRITVHRRVVAASLPAASGEGIVVDGGAALANPIAAMNAGDSPLLEETTLRERLLAWLAQTIGGNAADLRVTCQVPDDRNWRMSELAGRFEFEPVGDDLIGRTTIIVRQYRPDETVHTVRVGVNIERRIVVVSATRDLRRGQIITPDDVTTGELWQSSAMRQPVYKASDIIGQTIRRHVRKGEVIAAVDVQSPMVVRRGQLVTVRCVSGSLVLRSVLRAREDGAVGDLIRLTNEKTRQDVDARVTGPQEAVMLVRGGVDEAAIAQGGDQ